MKKVKTYSDATYNSRNPIARFAHRQRFNNSLIFSRIKPGDSVLDYGCGDGKFLNDLRVNCKKTGYEPYMPAMSSNTVEIYNSMDSLKKFTSDHGKFDVIVCFEVLEHLNEKNQLKELAEMRSLLKEDGNIVLSVPIEIGLATIIKNFRRMHLHYSPIYNVKNMLKSVFALPLEEHRQADGYLTHMGFNHKILEKLLKRNYMILNKKYSPFSSLNYNFNSQVFYRIRPIENN